jgi:hypothetical protein
VQNTAELVAGQENAQNIDQLFVARMAISIFLAAARLALAAIRPVAALHLTGA